MKFRRKIQRVFSYEFENSRYNVEEKIRFIQTQVEFALNKELKYKMLGYLRNRIEKDYLL
ncbi:hypothetical protein CJ485_21850 [Priestia filamentosa]|nr:hypothetical protein CJ485_21850 [Priestia filamentosa]